MDITLKTVWTLL